MLGKKKRNDETCEKVQNQLGTIRKEWKMLEYNLTCCRHEVPVIMIICTISHHNSPHSLAHVRKKGEGESYGHATPFTSQRERERERAK